MAKIAEVQEVARSALVPYARNAKIHSEEQVQKIANSIREFGFISPCLIDRDYNIIAGHGRVMAAELLGLETVPCIFIEGLTDQERRAYTLLDNKLAEAAWDFQLLEQELETITDIDMGSYGFDVPDLDLNLENLFTEAEPKEEKPHRIQCPNCGEWFDA